MKEQDGVQHRWSRATAGDPLARRPHLRQAMSGATEHPADAHQYSLSSLNWIEFSPAGPSAAPPPSAVLDLRDLFDAAVSAGFERVGIDLASTRSSFPDDTGHAAISAALRTRGLACSDVGILFIGVPWTEAHARQLATLAHELNSPTCLATFAGPVSDWSMGQLRRSAALLHEAGARVALEYMPVGQLKSIADASRICGEIGWDRCGLLLDSYHVCRAGSVRRQLSGLSVEQVSLVQLADGKVPLGESATLDARRFRLPAGYGGLAISEFLSRLRALGWAGTISPEVLSDDLITITPRMGAALLHASLRVAWEATSTEPPSSS
jgi:sugar phosphate isomerase/epimerase